MGKMEEQRISDLENSVKKLFRFLQDTNVRVGELSAEITLLKKGAD